MKGAASAEINGDLKTNDFASVLPLDPDDAQFVAKMCVMAAPAKGVSRGVETRGQFDTVSDYEAENSSFG